MKRIIKKVYNKMHWFSDADAWILFRLAAFTEAITWTLLISSIIIRNNGLPGGDIAVSIAGTIHGTMLLVYIILIAVLSRSMEWGIWRIVGGLAAGNIPFATIGFERFIRWHRSRNPVSVAAPAGYMED